MVVVAVAGGTGGMGHAIVDALVASGNYDVIVLSRTADPAKEKELGARIVATDYSDVAALTKTLEDNNVHTVISALNMMPHFAGPLEPNLIKAADESKVTKRIISSDWGVDPPKASEEDATKLSFIAGKVAAFKTLQGTRELEWTVFRNGYFMDYFGYPGIPTYLNPVTMFLDIAHDTAAIPGTGDVPAAFTRSTDVARFVVASLGLEAGSWEPVTYVYGDKVTFNEFLKLAEEVKGTKFKVTYDDVEKLERGEITELPAHVHVYAFFPKEQLQGIGAVMGLWFHQGAMDVDVGKALNNKFPEIKPTSIKELLVQAWRKSS